MSNVNVNKNDNIKIIKNFIQDLSFENPQNINENNSANNNNNDIDVNMNVVYKPYNDNFFSLNLKYILADLIALAEPIKTLCKKECTGLCPTCGIEKTISCNCNEHTNIDVWNKLKDLHFQ